MVATGTDRGPLLVVGESSARSRTVDALAPLGAIVEVDDADGAVDRLEATRAEIACAVVVGGIDGGDSTGGTTGGDSNVTLGLDRCERLRMRYPSLPIVFVPADGAGSETVAADAVAAGSTAYVPSDADEAALRERVERAIDPGREADREPGADADAPPTRRELESELERLRDSEELHRVVLNHMTDTVLVTDDAGAFTYVCPNVHYIFGYSAEEIRELGTIDALLQPDPIDRDALARDGVLTNVECTATDASGETHHLLVNAREVDIQGGTVLYSCRDVTTRKRREEALTALQRTARRLLYAETADEIADIVIEDAASVLDLEASALFRLDDGELRPVAHSDPMATLSGPPRPFRVNGETAVGYSFLERASLFFGADGPEAIRPVGFEDGTGREGAASDREPTDGETTDDEERSDGGTEAETSTRGVPSGVAGTSLPANPETSVESAAYVPLGEFGVFVAGSESADRFDEATRELAALLAAAAEAAFDRVERESELRAQERELQAQNRRLTRLNVINEIIREIDSALVGAETREEIERAVCARLTGEDRFAFAWIGASSPGATDLEVRAWDGEGRGYLDAAPIPVEGGAEPASRALADGSVTVVSNVADRLHEEAWRSVALARDFQSVISVPLSFDQFTYGTLTVYADRAAAFDEVTRPVLMELGETIASAMGAVERKRSLLTASSTRLEFEVDDDDDVFCRLAREADCTVEFDGGVRHTDAGAWAFVTVDGAPGEAVADAARELVSVDDVHVLSADETGGTLRLALPDSFLALRLADHGVVCRRIEATPESTRVVIDVPTGVAADGAVRVVESAFDALDLVSKSTVERASARDLRSTLQSRLTDRQLEVLQVAYYGGFFESPRETTGEAVAETLEISPAAFYQHNRTIQRKLFDALFDGGGLPAGDGFPPEDDGDLEDGESA